MSSAPATHPLAQARIQATVCFTRAENGLTKEWPGRVWLNPPYQQPDMFHFVTKLVEEVAAARTTAALLLTHNYTDTAWFHLAASACRAICFTRTAGTWSQWGYLARVRSRRNGAALRSIPTMLRVWPQSLPLLRLMQAGSHRLRQLRTHGMRSTGCCICFRPTGDRRAEQWQAVSRGARSSPFCVGLGAPWISRWSTPLRSTPIRPIGR